MSESAAAIDLTPVAQTVTAEPAVANGNGNGNGNRRMRSSNGTFFAGLVAFIALGVGCYSLWLQLYAHRDGAVVGYYVLDVPRLLGSKMAMAMESPTTAIEAQTAAQKLLADLNAVLVEYGRNGYVVLKRETVVSLTPEQDITHEVATKLGIDLSKRPEEVAKRMFEEQVANIGAPPGPANPGVLPAARPLAGAVPPAAGAPDAATLAKLPPEVRSLFVPPPAPPEVR